MGGTAVQSGPDRNGNDRLDDEEVEHVDYVCGEALLTRIVAEPVGARCVAAGVAFLFGRDRDRDGQLDDDEVEHSEVECGSVLARDVVVQTPADAAALAGIAIIGGSLSVAGTGLTELALPHLVQVRGALEIENDDSLVRVAMPALQAVDGELTLARNPQLTGLEMPGLQRVGSLTVDGNAALPDLDLRGLMHARTIAITSCPLVTDLDLLALTEVAAMEVRGKTSLRHLRLPLLRRSDLGVFDNPRLPACEVEALFAGMLGDHHQSGNDGTAVCE